MSSWTEEKPAVRTTNNLRNQFKALTKCSLLRGLLYLTCEMKMLSEGQECAEDRLDLLKTQKKRVFTRSFSSVRLSTWHSQKLT